MKQINSLMARARRKATAAVGGVTATAARARIVGPLLAVVLLGGAGVTLSTASASAATSAPSASDAMLPAGAVFPVKGVTPDTSSVRIDFADGNSFPYACMLTKTWGVDARALVVINGCTVRVWLHQFSNNTGVTVCIAPRTEVAFSPALQQIAWANLYISDVQAGCSA